MHKNPNSPNSLNKECALKDTLKEKHKVSFHWVKAKVIEINDDWIQIKFDESWLWKFVSNEQINNFEINVISKHNKEAKSIKFDEKIFPEIKNSVNLSVFDIIDWNKKI